MTDEKTLLRRLKQYFFELVPSRMAAIGFTCFTRSGDFYAVTDYGRKGVAAFLEYRWGAFRVEPNIFLRFDAVEELLFKFRREVRGTTIKKPNPFTICTNLGIIKNGSYRWWNNYTECDVKECVEEVNCLVVGNGLAFVRDMDGYEPMLQAMLVSTQRKTRIGDPIDLYQKALIMAALMNRFETIATYLPIFEKHVSKNSSVARNEFFLFRSWMKSEFGLDIYS